jgi:nickel-dependent lactate racemase
MRAEADMGVLKAESTDGPLGERQIAALIGAAAERIAPAGRRVLAVIPDHTRTCPLPTIVRALHAAMVSRPASGQARPAAALDFLVALGTHPPLDDGQIDRLLGVQPGRRGEVLPGSAVINHRWDDPAALVKVGALPAERISDITGGLFAIDVDVTVNRRVFDYDAVLVVGPVFPHEVVGFSGGSKYFFPGICGPALLNFFHWLGAVITSPRIIGHRDTPVRATLEAAADMLDVEKHALCLVVEGEDLTGMYFGDVREAWRAAVARSQRRHVRCEDRPYRSVLSQAPPMYDELWVGGKCMYKLEPVVADGGELIIYAPHIRALSATHGHLIEQIGYHTRDYFLAQWERFKDYPWGVLAHSTHVRGVGTYAGGAERPRIRVTLATGIPESLCRKVNLGYRDPATIDVGEWRGREDRGRLYVPRAGEVLYRLKTPPDWQRPTQPQQVPPKP